MAHLDQDDLNAIGTLIRDETAGSFSAIRAELKNHTSILKNHGAELKSHTKIFKRHSRELKRHSKELNRLGGLLEDLDERFKADSEVLRNNFKVKDQVEDHETRLEVVENTQSLMHLTLAEHSSQLNIKPS